LGTSFDQPTETPKETEQTRFWTPSRIGMAAGAIILSGFVIKQAKKNYDISIEWPF
jgi:hypothetical protein